ncbi:MAG: PorT family protein [Ferruginibacter sp.]|nr:PorT family protein [Ferruginibacter sp.]
MKKILLAGLFITGSLLTQAQFRVGIKGGLNFSDQARKDAGHSVTTKMHTELHAGVVGDVKIWKSIYLQPAIMYSRKGATHKSASFADTKIKMNYVELPLNIVYKKELMFGTVFAGGGPVIGYGFGGEMVQNGQSKKLYSDDIKNFGHEDISANLLAGIELNNGLFSSVSYQKGFRDIYKTDNVKIRNNSVSVSVGYYLNRKHR